MTQAAVTETPATDERPTPVLEARGLVKRYGQVTALDGCDFELLPGEIHAVIGGRSEERRVGKECRSRWSPYH